MDKNSIQQACCEVRRVEITEKDLPLCCPLSDERLWDAHPRVYLPIESLGEVSCPYCATNYYLI